MSEQGELLRRIGGYLDEAGVTHMVVGSLASSFHGEPRQTRDIDIVIEPDSAGVRRFLELLDQDAFYADADAAAEALERRTSFNVIERSTGWKVDLIVRRDRPFSMAEFDRRMPVHILDTDTHIASAEDTIIAKLEWATAGQSERQISDVVGILRAHRSSMDRAYVERWVDALGLDEAWRKANEEAERQRIR